MKKLGCKAVTVTFHSFFCGNFVHRYPGFLIRVVGYKLRRMRLPPLLTLAGGAFIVASRWKIPFLILMAAASMAFNIPLQNWLFSFGR